MDKIVDISENEDVVAAMFKLGTFIENYTKAVEKNAHLINQIKLLRNDITIAHEAQKSQWDSLDSSEKLIVKQQTIISKLVSVIDETKACEQELTKKNNLIIELQQQQEHTKNMLQNNCQRILEDHHAEQEYIKSEYNKKVEQLNNDYETTNSKLKCEINTLINKVQEIKEANETQLSVKVLDYEEQLHHMQENIFKMKNEMKSKDEKYQANIDIYKKKIEDLENKIKFQNIKNIIKNKEELTRGFNSNPNTMDNITNNPSKHGHFILASKFEKTNSTLEIHMRDGPASWMKNDEKSNKPIKRKLFNLNSDFLESTN